MKPFSHINLSPAMGENLKRIGYELMTPIQEGTIPSILKGKDVLAQAKTGSGKTAAFGIGLLERMNPDRYRVQALILCPTRELAEQVSGEIRRLAAYRHNIKVLTLTGGMPLRKQEHSLSHQAHIVVGTPGRIHKLLTRGTLVLDEVGTLVLDEADRMLDMGFIDIIREIIAYAPEKRQTLCFSATFPEDIKELSREIMDRPREITVDSQHAPGVIRQAFFQIDSRDRGRAVVNLIREYRPESTVVFCNTKDACRRVQEELVTYGLHALSLHGDMEQKERNETLILFSNGSSPILVATDVAARGLDIGDLAAVINYNLPFETETYVHRIGRTGRAGKTGLAFSLVKPDEQFRLDKINELTGESFSAGPLDCTVPEDFTGLSPAMVTLSVNGGRKNKISAGDILGALTRKGGLTADDVGKIDRLEFITFVAVRSETADRALKILSRDRIKGKQLRARRHD